MVDGVLAAAQHVSTVTAMRIFEDARPPMTRRDVGDVECAVAIGIPPLEFDNFFEAEIVDQVEQMMRDDQGGRGSGLTAGLVRDGAQRLAMQVIEVRMRYQDNIHGRQVAQVQPWLTQAFENKQPAREVRIDDDVLPAKLEEEAGVSDKGDAQLAVRNQFRFVGLAGARCYRGVPHQARELAGALPQRGIFQ